MTFNYPNMAATATRLLTKFGQVGTVKRQTVTGGGPADQSGGVAAIASYGATFVILPISARNIGLGVGETNLRETDVEFYLSVSVSVEPIAGDVLGATVGDFMVLSSTVIAPSGINVVYQGFARNHGPV